MVVNVGEIAEQAIRPADLGAQEASIARVSSELVESCLQPPLAGLRDRPEHGLWSIPTRGVTGSRAIRALPGPWPCPAAWLAVVGARSREAPCFPTGS
jgi:hypothetical protein